MNTIWVIWFFVFFGGAALAFSFIEAYAFRHPDRINTLSRFVWSVGQKWPLSLVIWGMFFGLLFGGLSVHFYWNWCPALMPAGTGG